MSQSLTIALYPVDPPSLSFFRMTDPDPLP